MGAWLSSIHVRSRNRDLILRAAEQVARETGALFYVGKESERGWTPFIVDLVVARKTAVALSEKARDPMFLCLVLDDDDFRYEYFRDGQIVDRYSSNPDAYGDDIPMAERHLWRGAPESYRDLFERDEDLAVCRKVMDKDRREGGIRGVGALEAVRLARSVVRGDGEEMNFVFASQRLRWMAKLLGLHEIDLAFHDFEGFDGKELRERFDRIPDDTAERNAERERARRLQEERRDLAERGVLVATFKGPGQKVPAGVVWASGPWGDALLVGTWWYGRGSMEGTTELYSGARLRERASLPNGFPRVLDDAVFSCSGKYLALRLTNAGSGLSIWRWPEKEIWRSESPGANLVFDSQDEVFYANIGKDIVAHRVAGGEAIGRLSVGEGRTCMAIHPDGKFGVIVSMNEALTICKLPHFGEAKRLKVGTGAPSSTSMEDIPEARELRKMSEEFARRAGKLTRAEVREVEQKMERMGAAVQRAFADRLVRSGLDLSALAEGGSGDRARAEEAMRKVARSMNPERIRAVQFSANGKWIFTASDFGARAWRWEDLHAAQGPHAPAPAYTCEARPAGMEKSLKSTYCYTLAYDGARDWLLFAGLEGIVEYLDLGTGATGTLFQPPEPMAIVRIALTNEPKRLIIQQSDMRRTGVRFAGVTVWDYTALCERV